MVGSAVPTIVESIAATKRLSMSPAITRTSCGVQGMRAGSGAGALMARGASVIGIRG
jgi:hypothetical protein